MIGAYTLESLLKKYGIDSNKVLNKNNNILEKVFKRENIDVAVCPKQDIINVFLYSSIDFNCIEKYFKYHRIYINVRKN